MSNTKEESSSPHKDDHLALLAKENIKGLILTVRGKQVLLDSDVARLYGYETKYINRAATRNKERFPEEFRFQLTREEFDEVLGLENNSQIEAVNDGANLKFQNGTSSLHGGRRSFPYVYSEQGIAMLSGLLKNSTAVQVSIGIMNAFVEMRHFIGANRDVFSNVSSINYRLSVHDSKLIEQETKINEVLAILGSSEVAKQNIFFEGQFYDAFSLIVEVMKKAKKSIVIVDNYIDKSVLDMLVNKGEGVSVTFVTGKPPVISDLYFEKFSQQYGQILIVRNKSFHDRFIILDDKEAYALGASLKDLGAKCFGVWKMEDTANQLIAQVNDIILEKKNKA